jgi:two-component system sensor histidine kinase YesM
MILQPFVENAVIHGIEPREEGGSLGIEARARENGGILLLVTDDGIGFDPSCVRTDPDALDDGRHIGIENSRRRMELLYGGDREYISIESAPGRGTRVQIEVPPETATQEGSAP